MNSGVFVSLLLIVSWLSQASSELPQCTTTACTLDSDCPNFNDPTYFPACISGICTNSNPTRRDIGESCNTTNPNGLCKYGLFCSTGTLDSVCQHTRTFGCICNVDEECEGGLCLNNSCDAVRSIGDICTSDLQCGSVCTNETCALGSVNDKCNGDRSCTSGFCDEDSSTCQTDTRGSCSPSYPNGKCEGVNSVCYGGQCYIPNGDVGASCNNTLPFPQCKVTLGCLNSTCQQVPEGSPCTDRSSCSLVQDCMCSGDGKSDTYGCYTKIGATCAATYQELDDCLSGCTERQSEGVPDSCASKCMLLMMEYTCCEGCAAEMTFYNMKGSCSTSLVAVQCCSSTSSCTEIDNGDVCDFLNSTSPTSTSTFSSPANDLTSGSEKLSVGTGGFVAGLFIFVSLIC